MSEDTRPAVDVDVRERGAPKEGEPQVLDRRLFMQLLVFRATNASPEIHVELLSRRFRDRSLTGVLYEDVNDPRGLGVLTFSEDPAHFVDVVRPAVQVEGLDLQPAFTMLGRTYSTGYEQDLAFWLLERPRRTVLDPTLPWAVWYPLRRTGAFNRLDRKEQGAILREHGEIGRAYGAADLAHDVRLACHGLDPHDNDFVIGLLGKELHPLSHVVQTMRRTRQTGEFMEKMGPFFVGRAVWRGG
ncbi:MAG: chlorite dismutase family protein [Deltaproteobacteria bacterium]|nr:chlorite dismutase family protein [Deltaproteobacteria bacterium]